MIRDRDRIYGAIVTHRLRVMGIPGQAYCAGLSLAKWCCRTARAKIHGPSDSGWKASISPALTARRSVLGAILRSFAALPRLSQGMPSRAAAIRELLKRGLASEGIEAAQDGQKSKDFSLAAIGNGKRPQKR